MLTLLGTAVLDIYDELAAIRTRLAFTASAESRPIQSLMVVGSSGAGKSTMVNSMIRHCLKLQDEQLKEPEDVEVEDEVFRAQSRVTLPGTTADEEAKALEAGLELGQRINQDGDDILPTGNSLGAMTALVTHVFFDPKAEHLQLLLTYREEKEVMEVLEFGKAVHDDNDEDSIATHDGRMAYFAAALLGIDVDGAEDTDATAMLRKHTGDFALPSRFKELYGSERRLTIKGRSTEQVLVKLQELIFLHTIGSWSHWAVRPPCRRTFLAVANTSATKGLAMRAVRAWRAVPATKS